MPKRDYSRISNDSFQFTESAKRRKTETALIPTIPGARRYTRRYPVSARKSRRSYRRKSYPGPKFRGIYAKTNRGSPELKSVERDVRFFPVSYGDEVGSYTWSNAFNNPVSAWTGNATGANIDTLNLIALGGDIFQRVGRKVTLKSLTFNCNWRMSDPTDSGTTGSALSQPVNIRTMIVWDKSPLGVQPALSTILRGVLDYQGNTSPMPRSPMNLDYRDRFRVLMDIRDTLSPGGDSARSYDRYIKLNKDVIFTSVPTADIGAIVTGALYAIFISDAFDVTMDNAIKFRPMCTYISRVRFTDC